MALSGNHPRVARPAFAAVIFLAALAAGPARAQTVQIVVDPATVEGAVDRRILGANQVWPLGMSGAWSPEAGTDPSFDVALREAALTTLRYPGGTVANTFRWRWAIGPQDQRLGQRSTTTVPFDSAFGPDEYGAFLDTYGMTGNIVVNIATGTAQEAADWVEYMTAEVGQDPNGLAQLRAANGHGEPYPITYWEVGNEIDASYWMAGTPTASDVDAGCTTAVCRYTFGGSGHFTNQGVGTFNDFTAAKSLSDGTASQSFHVQYPPVTPGTATVLVDGQAWTRAQSLAGAGQAYLLDEAGGVITFGDGTDGAIPPAGARISITYDSGPHDGYVQFRAAMKAVNPDIKVCMAFGLNGDDWFIQNAPAYDCIVSHPYIPGPSSALPLAEYHPALMLMANDAQGYVTTLQQAMAPYQPDAEVLVSEYGHAGNVGPADVPQRFHLSLSQGLFTANALIRWARLGLPWAQRHRLNDWVFTPRPEGAANVGATDNSLIAGPSPFVAEPQAKVFGLFSRTMGTQRLGTSLVNNPVETGSWGNLPALEVLATRREDGALGLIVVNQSGSNDVTATVSTSGMAYEPGIQVLTVNGPGLASYNTADDPEVVSLQASSINVTDGGFDYTFPAHSVTGFVIEPAPLACADAAAEVEQDSSSTPIAVADGCTNASGPVTVSLVGANGGAAHGTAAVVNNAIVYTPAGGFAGTDTVSFEGADGTATDGGVLTVTVVDVTPDTFSFTDEADVPAATVVESNAITVSGITRAVRIYITGGEYSINGSAYTVLLGTVSAGDQVTVRQTSANAPLTATDAVLTIGTVSDTFTVTTAEVVPDEQPDAFSFTPQADVPLGTEVISEAVTITGFNVELPITVAGGQYSIAGGPFTSAPGTINAGEEVRLRHTSASQEESTVTTTLTVGTGANARSAAFSSSTPPRRRSGSSAMDGLLLGLLGLAGARTRRRLTMPGTRP